MTVLDRVGFTACFHELCIVGHVTLRAAAVNLHAIKPEEEDHMGCQAVSGDDGALRGSSELGTV